MRLLQYADGKISLTKDLVRDLPQYAILSHTWGPDTEEVTFRDLVEETGKGKTGYRKVEFCAEQARRDGLDYFWVDTCCIDKSNNNELSTAINSMFCWYQNAARCYVYLSDIPTAASSCSQQSVLPWEPAFREHRWFTRGWTLQELLEPESVEFFAPDGRRLGDKRSLEKQIHEITGISVLALRERDFSQFDVEERFRWAEKRQTTHEENWAYCLLGIFGVFMPLIYGEGRTHAIDRLRDEIARATNRNLTVVQAARSRVHFLVPYQKNDSFVGRKAILEALEKRLVRSQARLSLFGLGGVGKTQIALQFAYWIHEKCADISVFWVHASNGERFRESYASIALTCRIAGCDDPKADVLQLVKRWLEAKNRGWWLMILDNADDAQLFDQTRGPQQYVPECDHGSVLVTTRNKQAGLRLAKGKPPMELNAMGDDESEQLFRANSGEEDCPSDDLQALCSRLEHLPLAIVQAAAFVQANTMTAGQYLDLMDRSDQTLVNLLSEEFDSVGRDAETPHAVAETWILFFEQIKQQDALAGDLLSLMSFFDRQAIALDFMVSYCDRHGHDSNLQLTKALGILKAFSFVTAAKDDTLDMHRLVQLATRNWLAKKSMSRYFVSQALLVMSDAYPYGSYENWAKCRAYLPHAYSVLDFEGDGSNDGKNGRAALLHCTAAYLDNQGAWNTSEKLLLEAVRLRQEILGKEDPDTLGSMANLASTCRNKGRWKAAEELEVQVMDTRKRVLGPEHPDTLTSINNLTHTWKGQGLLDEALSLMHRCVQLRQQILGPNHPYTQSSVSALEGWQQTSSHHSSTDEEEAASSDGGASL